VCTAAPEIVEVPLALSARNTFIRFGASIPVGTFSLASAGDNTYEQRGLPRSLSPGGFSFERYSGTQVFVALAATQFTAYGLTAEGQLYAWGTNALGLLGSGSSAFTLEQPIPTRVGSSLWRAVDGGNEHVCAIRDDGLLFCWGLRSDGRLGDGLSTGSVSAPTIVGSARWKQISAGERHTCGIQEDGSLWCWGYNSSNGGMGPMGSGQLGVGDTLDRNTPTRVGAGFDWREVSAGTAHSCAIKEDGSLWCWGEQSNWGRLGLGASDPGADVLVPQRVMTPAPTWSRVAAGNFHTCAIGDGNLYCWGVSARGQTGTGEPNITTEPTFIRGGFDAVAVAADHSCGREQATGAFFCWGRVADGRTGTGIDPMPPDGGVAMDLVVPTSIGIAE
jgi:alpha-tubulin suppressor-like RCC1 family protein